MDRTSLVKNAAPPSNSGQVEIDMPLGRMSSPNPNNSYNNNAGGDQQPSLVEDNALQAMFKASRYYFIYLSIHVSGYEL